MDVRPPRWKEAEEVLHLVPSFKFFAFTFVAAVIVVVTKVNVEIYLQHGSLQHDVSLLGDVLL